MLRRRVPVSGETGVGETGVGAVANFAVLTASSATVILIFSPFTELRSALSRSAAS